MSIAVDPRLNEQDQVVLKAFLTLLDTDALSQKQIWACMDLVWEAQGCNNLNVREECLESFYAWSIRVSG